MDAIPLVRFRLQLADGSRWWRAQCVLEESAGKIELPRREPAQRELVANDNARSEVA